MYIFNPILFWGILGLLCEELPKFYDFHKKAENFGKITFMLFNKALFWIFNNLGE